jgi:hypothetical protein
LLVDGLSFVEPPAVAAEGADPASLEAGQERTVVEEMWVEQIVVVEVVPSVAVAAGS